MLGRIRRNGRDDKERQRRTVFASTLSDLVTLLNKHFQYHGDFLSTWGKGSHAIQPNFKMTSWTKLGYIHSRLEEGPLIRRKRKDGRPGWEIGDARRSLSRSLLREKLVTSSNCENEELLFLRRPSSAFSLVPPNLALAHSSRLSSIVLRGFPG